ncbi:MAG TPA: efflux RND transporter periplasmic adaptor subunit [Bdellovibrionota bacterium]|nr:efflux RND transporter periplasmic adaptor subunit [Bdellovibrionota bacterium]
MSHAMCFPKNRPGIRLLFFGIAFSTLLTGCQKAPLVKAVKVTRTSVETTISTTTTGTVDAEQQAVLNFGVVGRVEAVQVAAGQTATKGQLLARLENRDVVSIYERALAELNRSKKLFSAGLVARATHDEAVKAYDIARANVQKTEIRAPFEGLVTDVNLEPGELSQLQTIPDTPPIRIVDQKPRVIKGDVDEVDLSRVQIGFPARVRIPAVRPEAFAARVVRLVHYVNSTKEQERTSRVELSISDPPERSIPVGASAEIEIIVASKKDVLAVPSRALLGTGRDRYAYRFENGRIHKAPVKIGIGNYERSEVLSGLNSGDTIVLPGDVELEDKLKVKTELLPWP